MEINKIIEEYSRNTGRSYSQKELSEILGWSTATMSLVINGNYKYQQDKEDEAARKLLGLSNEPQGWKPIEIKKDVIIATKDFNNVYELCNGLLDPNRSLTSSIGMVVGDAGRGKTTAVQRFAAENSQAVYILYMGYSKSQMFKEIAKELVGRYAGNYYSNLELIMESTKIFRKLIIIDEADRMPLSLLEDLRTLNERGTVPLLLVGEPALARLARKADRIESRIRKPRIEFHPLDYITLATLYHDAAGLTLSKTVAEALVKLAKADFRIAVNDMQNIVRQMNISHSPELTEGVLNEYKRS